MNDLRDVAPDSRGVDCACPLEAAFEIVPMATLSTPPGLHPPIITRGVLAPIGIRADSVRGMAPAEAAPLLDIPGSRTFKNYGGGARPLDGHVIVVSPGAVAEARGSRLAAGHIHVEVRE